mgnify:CR=1 FL=1
MSIKVYLVDDHRLFRTVVAQFVAKEITGLWQAEARDNPAFGAYRRLDLFYVENWSIGFDLAILWATAGRVLARSIRKAPTLGVVASLDPVANFESSVRTGES